MNVLIDIGHPAHIHYYRNLAKELENHGHSVFWTVKKIKVAQQLLERYGLKYILLPRKADSLIGKIWKQVIYDTIILKICLEKKIDIAIGTSVSIAHVSRITKVKSLVFDDDDDNVQPLVTKYVNPYADYLLSPEALHGKRNRKDTVYYPGYHELAYLHPKRFVPDRSVLNEIGITPGEKYFIMRFNAFKAHHDVGVRGLSIEQKLEIINILKPHGRILITTEREIESELKQYQLKIDPVKMHSIMAFATIFLGDSQTMTSEAAVLGVPSLRCNSFAGRISYLEEEEHEYSLTFAFQPDQFDLLKIKLNELLSMENLLPEFQKRKERMLKDKVDVTSFWLWFIEHLGTNQTIKDSPVFWDQFR